MKRGDIFFRIPPRDYGKPRPDVIVQSNAFTARDSVTVCLLTPTLVDAPLFRVRIKPGAQNGLRKAPDIMVDKIMTLKRSRLAKLMGALSDEETIELDHA